METGTVSILTSMRSYAALPQVTNLRSVRCARFRGGRLNMHQRPRPPRGHGDLSGTEGPLEALLGVSNGRRPADTKSDRTPNICERGVREGCQEGHAELPIMSLRGCGPACSGLTGCLGAEGQDAR
jgi:hypothetical protein